MGQIRKTEIHARRVRKVKMKKLRERFTASKSAAEKELILQKVGRVAPWMSGEPFLATVKK